MGAIRDELEAKAAPVVNVLESRKHVAATEHECHMCERTIPIWEEYPREEYRRRAVTEDGEFVSVAECIGKCDLPEPRA